MNLYFVRHGKTILNLVDRVQGWADSPLVEEGVQVARNTGYGLSDIPFDYIYASDTVRAVETANIIKEVNQKSYKNDIIKIPELREVNFGIYEGELNSIMWASIFNHVGVLGFDELFSRPNGRAQVLDATAELDKTGTAETYEQLIHRLMGAVQTIVADAADAKNVLIVSHGAAIGNLFTEITGRSIAVVDNSSVSLVEFKHKKYVVKSINDMSYANKGEIIRRSHQGKKSDNISPVSIQGKEQGEVSVYLVRHGKTLFNATGRIQGWSDSPLTKEGIQIATDLGKGLSDIEFSNAYTSDLNRAVKTADIILNQNKASNNFTRTELSDLRERCFGKYEGGFDDDITVSTLQPLGVSTLEELKALDNYYIQMTKVLWQTDETELTESYETMTNRVFTAFEAICKETAVNGGGNVLVVSHSNAIMAILEHLGLSDMLEIENASVSKILYKEGAFTIETTNDMSYVNAGARM